MSDSSQQSDKDDSFPTVYISERLNNLKGTLTSEDPLDQEYRLKQQGYDASHRRWRITILFSFALIGIAVVVICCLLVLISPESSSDDKKWASTFMATIVAGLVGFVTGKAVV